MFFEIMVDHHKSINLIELCFLEVLRIMVKWGVHLKVLCNYDEVSCDFDEHRCLLRFYYIPHSYMAIFCVFFRHGQSHIEAHSPCDTLWVI